MRAHERGWRAGATGLGGERVARGVYAIEHVMPRRWQANWPLAAGVLPSEREALIHTIGNLTLLTGRLNSRVSNGPWGGEHGKWQALHAYDVLMLNRRLLESGRDGWRDEQVRARGQNMIDAVLSVWPVPAGHRSTAVRAERRPRRRIEVIDLLSAGLLEEGATLYARRQRLAGRTATVLPDGALDVDGVRHASPSGAARAVSKTNENGWGFWLVDPKSRRTLYDLYRQYIEDRHVEAEEADLPDEDDADLPDEDDDG